jgi:DNA-binding NarL/FixJ family response regulator
VQVRVSNGVTGNGSRGVNGHTESAGERTGRAITVTIVHGNKGVLNSLLALIGGTEGFTCVGVHGRLDDALSQAALENPRVALVDLELEDLSDLARLGQLRERCPGIEILVLAPSLDSRLITTLLELGVGGCLVKPVAPAQLLEAIRQMDQFGVAISTEAVRLLVNVLRQRSTVHRCLERLSEREREILDYLSRGYLSKQIADRCLISVQTVNSHLANIYDKLGVHSRAGAVGKFLAH